ncbi:MAG TPA: class I SAM-dependent methyltransferase [Candidatus Levybacteria bacterium]|nr:class I SAM-dependent methyltransferase [Candidatus Levybacteria bacterium]
MFFIFLFILLVILLIVLSFVWPPDSPWAPQWRIKRSVSQTALQFAKVNSKDIVYELGCGDGEFTLTAAEEFGAKAVGIEIDPVRFLVSWVRAKLSKSNTDISIIRKDFKKVDLANATVIYMYLIPLAMKRLLPQLKKQLNSGTRVISYRYKIPLSQNEKTIQLVKEEKKEKIFLYTVNQNTEKD